MSDAEGLTRRQFVGTLGALSFAAFASGKGIDMAHETPPKPNLVFVLADQLRYASCGYAGDARARTPNLDQFARQGANFCNAVSGHPVCAAYRASFLTGKYTTSTGMVINELRMNPNHECLGHVLARHGYETAYIGKWHLWANELGNHYDPKNSFVPPGKHRLGFDGFWAAYNFHHEYYKGYYHTESPEKIPVDGYEPDFQTDLAIQKIRGFAKAKKPFALVLSVGTPHDPWNKGNVPPEYWEKFVAEGDAPRFTLPPNYKPDDDPYADGWGRYHDAKTRKRIPQMMRGYYAMTASLDWNFARLMRSIDDAAISDNTIVVFTSDHGEMFGAQGRRAKNIFYEEAARVPFLIRWPKRIPGGRVANACLNTPDILPTLLSMMGLAIPSGVEGMDLSHCALGKSGPEPEAALLMNTGACAAWEDGYEWRALRDKQYTYAIYRKDRKEFLFDNREDPYQLRNLADASDHAVTMKRFRELLKTRMDALDDAFQPSSWYRDHWTNDRIITDAIFR